MIAAPLLRRDRDANPVWYSMHILEERYCMANIGTLLRDEIARLSRRTIRGEVGSTKKATAQHRRDIAALKRKVAQLERQVALLVRRTVSRQDSATPPPAAAGKRMRFVAKGLRSQRNRLGLSAAEFGQLAVVSAQSIY